jgi:hypothetical protein
MEDKMRHTLLAALISLLIAPTGTFAQTPLTSLRLPALPPAVRQQQPPNRSWPGRHPVLFGALVGLGTGLAVEAAVIPGKSGGEPHSAYLPMFSAVGAGIGSLVGLIVSVSRR